MPTERERRFIAAAEAPVRVQVREDQSKLIEGYAAVFYREGDEGTEYRLWDTLYERIMPHAFDRAIKEKDDARGLFNHSPDFLLGRRSAGTLRLSVDKRGLKYEIDPPDTQVGRDVITSIDRGDLTGSSFAFIVRKATWVEEEDRDIRQIEDVELFDVGPVTFPAYEATTTGLRSNADLERELKEWKAHKESVKRDKARAELEIYNYRARVAAL